MQVQRVYTVLTGKNTDLEVCRRPYLYSHPVPSLSLFTRSSFFM
jgi:hypothetical protein